MPKEIVCAWCHRNAYFGNLIAHGDGPYYHEQCRADHNLLIGIRENQTTGIQPPDLRTAPKPKGATPC